MTIIALTCFLVVGAAAASILGRKTDIMTRDSLHRMLREKIESAAVRVF